MSKQLKPLIVVTMCIFLTAVIGSIFILKPTEKYIVEIVQNNTVLYSIDLNNTENQEIIITSDDGKTNTVLIENGKICISHAQCPDQTCVKMGVLYSESLPIVCLPNKLIIRYCE